MEIETPQEYGKQEKRLEEIKQRLEKIAEAEHADIGEVLDLKQEASVIAKALNTFLKSKLSIRQ